MNTTDIRALRADELDLVGGGKGGQLETNLHRVHIEGKGDLIYGSIEVNGYALPFAQWHPK